MKGSYCEIKKPSDLVIDFMCNKVNEMLIGYNKNVILDSKRSQRYNCVTVV